MDNKLKSVVALQKIFNNIIIYKLFTLIIITILRILSDNALLLN